MNGSRQIVAPSDMAHLVREDGLQLLRRRVVPESLTAQQNRARDSKDAGLNQRR